MCTVCYHLGALNACIWEARMQRCSFKTIENVHMLRSDVLLKNFRGKFAIGKMHIISDLYPKFQR